MECAPVFSIRRCVGTLHQNKRIVRNEGLADLVAALEGFVCADEITYNPYGYEQAMDRCFYFLRSGSTTERKDAYRAIGLYALTVGPKAEILDRLFDADRLSGMVPSSPSDTERAVAAIGCLVAATLACASCVKRAADAKRTVKAIWEVIEEAGDAAIPRVLAAAMSAWTVVLPAVRDIEAMTPFVLIAKLLRSDDPAVRMAAGEALAVCIELSILPCQPRAAHWYYHNKPPIPEPDERPSLESRVSDLAFGEKYAHRKEHAEEMSLFRQIHDLLMINKQQVEELDKKKNNERPEESNGPGVVKVSKRWVKLVQLNFLKQYIGEGFDTHYNLNLPFFRDSLGLTRGAGGSEEEDLPANEKKQLRKTEIGRRVWP
jgi:hypothetical protein